MTIIAVDQFEKAKYWRSVELRLVEEADAGATMGNVQAMPALQWHQAACERRDGKHGKPVPQDCKRAPVAIGVVETGRGD